MDNNNDIQNNREYQDFRAFQEFRKFRATQRRPGFKSQFTDDGKLQPQDKEIEDAVLGALMLEQDAYAVVCDLLKPESFYDPANQKIYEAINKLGINQQPIDMLTVTQQMRADGTLDEIGGPVHISELTGNVASAAHIEYHARIVAQKYLARQLITFCSQIESKAFDEGYDVDDLLQEAEGKLFQISQGNLKKDYTQINPVLNQAMEQIDVASKREDGMSGVRTGFDDLDKMTSGWQNSDLVIIAARPAMGKTAFVLSMAKNIALDYKTPVAIFSLEMSNLQLVNRLICNVCEIESEKIKSGKLTPAEWEQINHRIRALYDIPLYVDDSPSLSIFELRTKARRLVKEHQVKIIIIDYLQLMNASGMKFGSREQEVSTISRNLKQLAKELNIPIIALSQLSRKVEERNDGNKRPQLSDLRESGAIEQDADIVCFIHRPEYYTKSSTDAEGRNIKGLAEFILAKHRSGAVGDVDMTFVGKFARFQNYTEGDYRTIDSQINGSSLGDAADNNGIDQIDTSKFDFSGSNTPGPNPDFLSDGTL